MYLRDYEGGEIVDVVKTIGPGEIESLKAGVFRLIRVVGAGFEHCVSVDENDSPIWDAVTEGENWPTASEMDDQ